MVGFVALHLHCDFFSRNQPKTQVTLVSSDKQKFEVDVEVAAMSQTIKNMIEDVGEGEIVVLPNVSGRILSKVVEFCAQHVKAEAKKAAGSDAADDATIAKDLRAWDAIFVKVDQDTLFELVLAGNYLDLKPLLDVACDAVVKLIDGKTPAEIRKIFNIVNDFTPEEEEEVRRENQWAFDL